MDLSSHIDHTILKPDTTLQEIEQLCNEAVEYGFAAVCVPPPFVKRVVAILSPTKVNVATVVGFPFGYAATESKVAEAVLAIVDGADEVDMVINIIALRMHDWKFITDEVTLISKVVHNKNRILKVIIESGILDDDDIVQCCHLIGALNIDFMKTSTGYTGKGASIEAVRLMRNQLPDRVKIKASGGIRDYTFAKALIEAGADRLGCSASVAIARAAPGYGSIPQNGRILD